MTDELQYVLPEKLKLMIKNAKMNLDEERKKRLLYIPYLTNQNEEKLAAFFWNELVKDQERMKQQSAYEMNDIELAQRFAEFLTGITNPRDVLKEDNYFAKVNTPGNVVVTVDIHEAPKRTGNVAVTVDIHEPPKQPECSENLTSSEIVTPKSGQNDDSIQCEIPSTKSPITDLDCTRIKTPVITSFVTESDSTKNWMSVTKRPVADVDIIRKTKNTVPSDEILVIEEHKSIDNEAKKLYEKKNGQKKKSRSLRNIFGCLLPCLFRRRSSQYEESDM